LEVEQIVAPEFEAKRLMTSLLAGHAEQVALPIEAVSQRYFKIRAAESPRERRSANRLVDSMYSTRGYKTTPLPEEGCPYRKTFLATDHNSPIGTLTIGRDSSRGLLVEELFAIEVARFRDAGLPICEFTKLAMDRRARSPRLLAALFHVAYAYAHRVNSFHSLLIEVNPRHVRYYQSMLGFQVIGEPRHNPRVDAPAVLLSLDLNYAKEQIEIYGGKPQLASSERSAYPYFFSALDEDGIVGRLRRVNEDIAHVFESEPASTVATQIDDRLH
jgi:hypothetical protein